MVVSRWIKRAFHAVEGWIVALHIATFLAFVPLPISLTSSNTLREYICGGAVLGGFLGYFFSLRWAGEGRPKCIRQRRKNIVLTLLSVLAMVFVLESLSPLTVMRHPALKGFREELMESPRMANLLLAGLGGLTLFFLISSVTLSSPKLWKARLRDL